MKKIFILISALASLCAAHQVSVNIEDAYSYIDSLAGLHFNIHNAENQDRNVRIGILFTSKENQKFFIDRVTGCSDKNIPGINRIEINLYDTDVKGNYVLDVMVNMPAQGTKDFCLNLQESKLSKFKKNNFKFQYDWNVDGTQPLYVRRNSPLDNKVTYNYIAKNNRSKYSPGEIFNAKTMHYNGDLTEEEMLDPMAKFKKWDWHYILLPARSIVDLNIDSYGGYKDTRMLMAALGSLIDQYEWNASSFDGHIKKLTLVEDRDIVMGRCWAIAIFNIYSYLFGNRNTIDTALTQDEIVFIDKIESSNIDPATGIFTSNSRTEEADEYAANTISNIMKGAKATAHPKEEALKLSGQDIYEFIRESSNSNQKGKPLYISVKTPEGGHALLIDGLAVTADEKMDTLVHLVNLDNFGTEIYMYLDGLRKFITGYVTYDMPTSFRGTEADYPVDKDSDGDGIIDFDEHYRFNTNPYDSSDGSGISDYEKIYNIYINKYFNYRNLNEITLAPPSTDTVDIPSTTALYALDYLAINDNTTCFASYNDVSINNTTDGCQVASEGTNTQYSINMGSKSFANTLYSKGRVFVRSRARTGNIVIYNPHSDNSMVDFQKEDPDLNKGKVFYPNSKTWPFIVHKNLESINNKIGNNQKIIKNGETFTISGDEGHNNFRFLKVESGGKLIIGTGEMYIGSIQLESGSTFKFEHPRYSSILHLNGNVIWRGNYEENRNHKNYNMPTSIVTAMGFKVYQHSDSEMEINSIWHGTIIAPYSKVVMAQSSNAKRIYGHILAKKIVIHQNSIIYKQMYNPIRKPVAKQKSYTYAQKDIVDKEKNSNPINIIEANRNTINFNAPTSGLFTISILKTNGAKVYSFSVNKHNPGYESLNWNSTAIPNGVYLLSISHNGKVNGKIISLN